MKLFKETDDIWRLYHREWVVVHTLPAIVVVPDDPDPVPGRRMYDIAHDWAHEHLGLRVREQDVKIVLHTDNQAMFWAHVEVFKDNLKGEFKHVDAAQTYAAIEQYDEYTIVPRNSKSDHEIRNYGVVKL